MSDTANETQGRFDMGVSGHAFRLGRWYFGWVYTFHAWNDRTERNYTVWLPPLPEAVMDRIVDWWMER